MGSADRPPPRELGALVAELLAELDDVAAQLGDEEATADIEDLANALGKVHDDARAAAARMPGNVEIADAARHLREACDLIDDGMPADAVIFEVLAARARLALG